MTLIRALFDAKIALGSALGLVALLLALAVLARIPVNYNLRNLLVRWPTTSLITLAFTLVIALLVGMLAFVNGMYKLTEQSGQPGNVVILSDGSTDESMSNLGFNDINDVVFHPLIQRDGQDRPLCSKEIYLVVTQPIPVKAGEQPRRRFLQVRGIDDPEIASQVHGLDLYPGGAWFAQAGVRAAEANADDKQSLVEVVLGEGIAGIIAKDYGLESIQVNQVINFGDRKAIVVGIMNSAGSTFGSEVWAKASLIGPMFGKGSVFSSLVARSANEESAQKLAEDLQKNYKKTALRAQPEREYFSSLSQTNLQFLYAITLVAAVLGVGGVFAVMNTMFAAVSQRVRDIGVLRIIGYSPWRILISFLTESVLLGLIGGAVGLFLGSFFDGWNFNSIVSSGAGGKFVVFKLAVGFQTHAWGVFLSVMMGFFGGLLPAIAAVRIKPLDAVR